MAGVRGPSPESFSLARPNRRARNIGIALLLLSVVFFGVNYAQKWWLNRQIEQRAAQLQQRIDQQEAWNAQLRQDIIYYRSKPFIMDEARVLGMSRSGETLISIHWALTQPRVVHVQAHRPVAREQSPAQHLLAAAFSNP